MRGTTLGVSFWPPGLCMWTCYVDALPHSDVYGVMVNQDVSLNHSVFLKSKLLCMWEREFGVRGCHDKCTEVRGQLLEATVCSALLRRNVSSCFCCFTTLFRLTALRVSSVRPHPSTGMLGLQVLTFASFCVGCGDETGVVRFV